MRTRRLTLAAIPMLLATRTRSKNTASAWAAIPIGNLVLELIHEKTFEIFAFGSEGTVAATLGMKNVALTAPLLYWRVEDDHLIISHKPRSETYVDLHAPRLSEDVLTVKRGLFGEAKYKVKKR